MNIKDIVAAIEIAKNPAPRGCGECNENFFAPMDKLSIALYGKCAKHLEDDSIEQNNLLKLAEAL